MITHDAAHADVDGSYDESLKTDEALAALAGRVAGCEEAMSAMEGAARSAQAGCLADSCLFFRSRDSGRSTRKIGGNSGFEMPSPLDDRPRQPSCLHGHSCLTVTCVCRGSMQRRATIGVLDASAFQSQVHCHYCVDICKRYARACLFATGSCTGPFVAVQICMQLITKGPSALVLAYFALCF